MCGEQRDIDSSYYKKVQEMLGEEAVQMSINSLFELSMIEEYRTEFQEFRKVAQLYSAGLGFYLDQR